MNLTVGKIEFSPGPWKVSPLDGRTIGPVRVLQANGTNVPQMQAVAVVKDRLLETSANGRLIAAAPEMFEVLQRCAELLDDYQDVNDGDDGQPRPNRAMSLLQDVEAVIAKVEGR